MLDSYDTLGLLYGVLFPTEETNGENGAKHGDSEHDTDRQQNAAGADTEERIFHHRKSLCQRENAEKEILLCAADALVYQALQL